MCWLSVIKGVSISRNQRNFYSPIGSYSPIGRQAGIVSAGVKLEGEDLAYKRQRSGSMPLQSDLTHSTVVKRHSGILIPTLAYCHEAVSPAGQKSCTG